MSSPTAAETSCHRNKTCLVTLLKWQKCWKPLLTSSAERKPWAHQCHSRMKLCIITRHDYGPWKKTVHCSVAVSPLTNQVIGFFLERNSKIKRNLLNYSVKITLSLLTHCCSSGPFSQKEAENFAQCSETGKKDPRYRRVSTVTPRNLEEIL